MIQPLHSSDPLALYNLCKDESIDPDTQLVKAKELISGQSSLDTGDEKYTGHRPIHAALLGNRKSLFYTLLEAGAKTDPTKKGDTLFHVAATISSFDEEIFNTLIALNIPTNTLNEFNETPLHRACYKDTPTNRKIIKFLVSHGGYTDEENDDGETFKDVAHHYNHENPEFCEWVNKLEKPQ